MVSLYFIRFTATCFLLSLFSPFSATGMRPNSTCSLVPQEKPRLSPQKKYVLHQNLPPIKQNPVHVTTQNLSLPQILSNVEHTPSPKDRDLDDQGFFVDVNFTRRVNDASTTDTKILSLNSAMELHQSQLRAMKEQLLYEHILSYIDECIAILDTLATYSFILESIDNHQACELMSSSISYICCCNSYIHNRDESLFASLTKRKTTFVEKAIAFLNLCKIYRGQTLKRTHQLKPTKIALSNHLPEKVFTKTNNETQMACIASWCQHLIMAYECALVCTKLNIMQKNFFLESITARVDQATQFLLQAQDIADRQAKLALFKLWRRKYKPF